MSTETLTRLQHWYQQQCDGEWEHQHGVIIDTLDNPGWTVEIDLRNTQWATVTIASTTKQRSDDDWVHFEVADGHFRGARGPLNLAELLEEFLTVVGG